MKSVLILLITTSALAVALPTEQCIAKYAVCLADIATLRNHIAAKDKTQACNSIKTAMACVTKVAEECHSEHISIFKGYQDVFTQACSTDPETQQKWNETANCVGNSTEIWNQCMPKALDLAGQPICNAVKTSITCYITQIEIACSANARSIMDKLLRPIADQCENLIGTEITLPSKECITGISNCNYILHKCEDMQGTANCILKVLPSCAQYTGVLIPLLQAYVHQIPEYCNSKSPIRKNLDKSYKCITEKESGMTSCSETFREVTIKAKDASSALDEESLKKNRAALYRAIVKSIDCVINSLSAGCGNEAKFTLNYILAPMKDFLEDMCIPLTGSKCSGAVAITASFGIVLFSIYISFRRND